MHCYRGCRNGRIGACRPLPLRPSEVNLFGKSQGVIDLHAEISNGAFELGVSQEELDRTKVAGLPVDHRYLGSPQRMCAVGGRVEADRTYPALNQPCVLPGRQSLRRCKAAVKQEVRTRQAMLLDQIANRRPGLVGDFELDRPPGLLLHNGSPILDRSSDGHILHPKSNEVTPSQLAVDPEIEEGEFTNLPRHLEPNADGHDLFHLEGGFLTGELPARNSASPTAGANRGLVNDFKCHRREPSAHPPAPCRRGRHARLAQLHIRMTSIDSVGRSWARCHARESGTEVAICIALGSKLLGQVTLPTNRVV